MICRDCKYFKYWPATYYDPSYCECHCKKSDYCDCPPYDEDGNEVEECEYFEEVKDYGEDF